MALSKTKMANQVSLSHDGWFRLPNDMPFIPLGGFHGNVIPMSLLTLSEAQRREYEPNLWEDHLDLCDAPEPTKH